MKRIGILLGIFCIMTSALIASSLDEAALALSKGEVTEESLKNNFSKSDFYLIMEKYKGMRLERARKETEKEKVNSLLKQRNAELQDEIKKIKATNLSKKFNSKRITIDEAVKNTFKGLYGDNPERVNKLRDLGFNSQEIKKIQDGVNKLVEKEKIKNN